jgi:hypothetical protein
MTAPITLAPPLAAEIRGLLVAALLADLAEHPELPTPSAKPALVRDSTPATDRTPWRNARTRSALPASPGRSPRRPRQRPAQPSRSSR